MYLPNHKVAYVECEGACGFGVVFDHDVRSFFFCSEHKFGVTVPIEDTRDQICRPCGAKMGKYELYDEDNLCPICRNATLAVCYVMKGEKIKEVESGDMNKLDAARKLVRERIAGTRKGTTNDPTYLHSFRVEEMLRRYEYSEDVCLAGLLHDVVEDGSTTFEELDALGFSDQVVNLVRLCSHDVKIENKDARWMVMIVGLIKAHDADAWAIKIADILDNVEGSKTMEPVRGAFIRTVKAPMLVAASIDMMKKSPLWCALRNQCV